MDRIIEQGGFSFFSRGSLLSLIIISDAYNDALADTSTLLIRFTISPLKNTNHVGASRKLDRRPVASVHSAQASGRPGFTLSVVEVTGFGSIS